MQVTASRIGRRLVLIGLVAAAVLTTDAFRASAQESGGTRQVASAASPSTSAAAGQTTGAEKHISPAQATELFRSVDQILQFASDDTKLPIKEKVKRKLTTREAVGKYVVEKFNDDADAKRMQRGEIVLKKFGLLDRDFHLGPFLVSLLTEQIAGYYDDKTKTVNLLDWIGPEAQKSVLAHELTHALQDQHVGLEKWGDKSETDIARNVAEDNRHLATDEADTARDAVLEGQAMAVFVDYALRPSGRTLLTAPDMVEGLKDNMADSSDSPVMARAPLLLQQSLLFPYREGLSFEQALWKDSNANAAFAGALDRPPSTSYEILNPAAYERRQKLPLLTLPDIHGVLDADYSPYDVGVMGALDVRMLIELFAGPDASAALTPQWDGGLYYAAQQKAARTPEQKASTASLGLLYLSRWKTKEAADKFAAIYADELGRQYSGVSRDSEAPAGEGESVFKTNEGPVLIAVSGRLVFVSESFDLATATKLQLLLTNAQGGDETQSASATPASSAAALPMPPSGELTGSMVHFISSCGLMKVALGH